MDPDISSKRARLGHHTGPVGHAPGANSQSQSSSLATSVNPPNPTPTPAILATSSSTSKDTRVFKLKNPFRALGTVATVIPPLQPVVDLLAESMDSLSISSENRKDYEAFVINTTTTIETLKGHLNHPNPVALTESISNTIEELRKQAEYISKKQGSTGGKRYMDAERDAEDFLRCYRNVDALLHRLHIDIGITISGISHETLGVANKGLDVTSKTFKLISDHLPDTQLAEMTPVKEARYDAGEMKVRRTKCTPGTRGLLLEDLVKWANDEDGAKVYWMNGMAGTGKTTIACSLCHMLKRTNQLAASFFCSRQLPGCRDISRIMPTLSYQLARRSPTFKNQLCRVLKDDPDVCSVGIARQFEMLISEPLRKVDQTVRADRLVIVIDALDECSDSYGAQLVLDALFQFGTDLPVKFFITCRPEPTLFDKVSSEKQAVPSIFHLHNIEHSVIQADIETYLNAQLASIGVSDRQIKLLAERSGKLFIYAATAVQYIRPTNARVDPQSRLQTILGVASKSSRKAHEQLDELYTTILSAALDNTALEPSEVANVKLVLHTVLCAREPMTIEALARLLRLKSVKEARLALEPLGSVLHVSDSDLPVSTLHASFPDYMHDQERSKQFWSDPGTHHEILSRQCFATMENLLQFNICGLESSFVVDMDVPDFSDRVEKAIPSHLFYACRHWSEHLVRSRNVNAHAPILEDFLSNRVLFWMEVMSLKKCMALAASILSDMCDWAKRAGASDDACALCRDAQRFATVFGASPTHTSTPHMYVSILALWNRDDPMWAQYGTRANGLGAEGSALNNRQSDTVVSWRPGGRIISAAVSHDGRRVITSSEDHKLHVWGTYTGTLLVGPFVGHTDAVWSVTFSPDDTRIASASFDHTIRVWDAYTGHPLGAPFEGHQSGATCVTFSPDGSRLASGSFDRTVRIWDAKTGQTAIGPFQGHSAYVRSIAYSPDGGRIVSSSYDGIYIWDAQIGDIVAGPLRTDLLATPVALSPGGSHFVSGAYRGAVCVWDAQTGQEVGPFVRGQRELHSLAFSPDGSHLATCGSSGLIRVWDTVTRQQVNEHNVACEEAALFAFLPNGYHILYVDSQEAICIWDSQARQARSNAAVEPLGVSLVGFLPDGGRIAGDYVDGTFCIWDAHTGGMLAGPLTADSGAPSAAFPPSYNPPRGRWLASRGCAYIWDFQTRYALPGPFRRDTELFKLQTGYSPGGEHIVSGSNYKPVHTWHARTGLIVAGPFVEHVARVTSLAFSPNCGRIVSGSDDNTIRVWDVQTGHPVGDPFEGHTRRVTCVAYSPDGSRIVSGSWDRTVRVWDAETGNAVAAFKAHAKVTSVAYSPDGSCFASGSDDGIIRIWRSQANSDDDDPLENWTMNEDGWIVGDDSSMLFWVPSDLRPALLRPQNIALLRPEGFLRLKFKDACIGPHWAECFTR
ncbi:hypothetical protein FRC06_006650 [Ceratobasidium sp. 370]|nr:hypothetical protein FRC06_006650 [Ceratobasidium sp. 370]